MSAYNEFINRALQTDKIYEELPLRIRENITLTEWRNRVVEFCIGKGKAYATSLASTVCGEQVCPCLPSHGVTAYLPARCVITLIHMNDDRNTTMS